MTTSRSEKTKVSARLGRKLPPALEKIKQKSWKEKLRRAKEGCLFLQTSNVKLLF